MALKSQTDQWELHSTTLLTTQANSPQLELILLKAWWIPRHGKIPAQIFGSLLIQNQAGTEMKDAYSIALWICLPLCPLMGQDCLV
ncbi:hypothetical protein Cflav_PD4817 [Pedosphaera parvula Ellin514]|uniref:Uncharacterized protein n=1 Tax=Pedosphaera parvula (strain Ellin514) TaxID=320771 RepID=B9XER3_PEDPL|nr:hypothetical protein Cflav_PD4817 [Pedosphaera parvula Ellin514]